MVSVRFEPINGGIYYVCIVCEGAVNWRVHSGDLSWRVDCVVLDWRIGSLFSITELNLKREICNIWPKLKVSDSAKHYITNQIQRKKKFYEQSFFSPVFHHWAHCRKSSKTISRLQVWKNAAIATPIRVFEQSYKVAILVSNLSNSGRNFCKPETGIN